MYTGRLILFVAKTDSYTEHSPTSRIGSQQPVASRVGKPGVSTPSTKERCRAQALLWLDEGETIEEVAPLLHVSRQTVYTAALRLFPLL
ncbi:MAG: helix-turn-helix domain-containing protein [Planctomycetaceae bacterium]|nr:helix-turn-helix domain-containing protein [Planctomycetaceae bacterium]